MSLISKINVLVRTFKHQISIIFGKHYPPDLALCLVGVQNHSAPITAPNFSLKDIIGDGFLWAVPKHRRTLEKRMKRKFGTPYYGMKIFLPKKYLKTCHTCGDTRETGVLCPTCFKKVMDETKEMQDAIQEKLKLEPIENEVVVVYEDEKDKSDEFFEGKRIVEMKKPRPAWFSKNLLQSSTQKPAQTSDVKPSDLG